MDYKTFNPDEVFVDYNDRLWFYINARDEGLCQVCAKAAAEQHHVKYRSHGGKHKANEIISLCKQHHYSEHNVRAKPSREYYNLINKAERRFRERMI